MREKANKDSVADVEMASSTTFVGKSDKNLQMKTKECERHL